MSHATASSPAASPSQSPPTHHRFSFTGTALGYTQLCLKHLVLSVLSLGIYSAWAKVENQRYLLQHTWLDGHNFDYRANPRVILRSRMIVALLVGVWLLGKDSFTLLDKYGVWLLLLALPWMTTVYLSFRCKNTWYRGARFGYHDQLGQSYARFFKGYFRVFASAGTRLAKEIDAETCKATSKISLGDQPFRTITADASHGRKLLLFGVLTLVLGVLATGLLLWQVLIQGDGTCLDQFPSHSELNLLERRYWAMALIWRCDGYLFFGMLLLLPMVMGPLFRAQLKRQRWANTCFGAHRFACTERGRDLVWLSLSNTALCLVTCGLALPWARIRSRRYTLENLHVYAQGPLMQGVKQSEPSTRDRDSDSVGNAVVDALGGSLFG